jgi:hypothetical protein
MRRKMTELIHEGGCAAEVEVEFIYDTDWSPCPLPEDVEKLESVRAALRTGNIAAAAKNASVFTLTPVSGLE